MKDPKELLYMIHARTDADGRWQARNVRRMKFLNVYLEHPDFLSDATFTDRRYTPPTAALVDGTDVQVMKLGLPVVGRVLDPEGRPIAGASVVATPMPDLLADEELPRATTDGDGRFRFPHAKPGPLHLIARAPGRGPGVAEVDVAADLEPAEIRLEPGKTLAGRVVDAGGRPLARAFVNVDSWRRYRCLGVYLATDADGRFRWDEAPGDGVMLNVGQSGHLGVFRHRVEPGQADLVFALKPALGLSGTVRDASTKKRVEQATVETGLVDPTTRAVTWRTGTGPGQPFLFSGNLQGQIDASAAPAFRFRVTALGFKPAVSPEYPSDAGEVAWDVNLEPGDVAEGPVGKVGGPDGAPVAGAVVYVVGRRGGLGLTDGLVQSRGVDTSATTAPDGSFRLPAVAEHFALVVVHDLFFGMASKAEYEVDRTLRVAPWGRVEGVARVGSKPAAGQALRYSAEPSDRFPGIHIGSEGKATTDPEGRFAFERVPPIAVRIARDPGDGPDRPFGDIGRLFPVKAGETTRAEVGGIGRPVVGRVVPPQPGQGAKPRLSGLRVDLDSNRAYFPYPLEFLRSKDSLIEGSWGRWGGTWRESDAGRDYLRDLVRRSMKLGPDAAFRFDDVPPGVYRLAVELDSNVPPSRRPDSGPRSDLFLTFEVPEVAGGQSDEPLDLGPLTLWTRTEPVVGEPAPNFKVTTVDGREVTLADYRGRFLLLDFGAPWVEQARIQVGRLDAIRHQFGKDERLAILSLTVDRDTPETRAYVADKLQSWGQAVIGPLGLDNAVARAYGIGDDLFHPGGMPREFLIGPDGKLIAKDLHYQKVGEAVGAALLKK